MLFIPQALSNKNVLDTLHPKDPAESPAPNCCEKSEYAPPGWSLERSLCSTIAPPLCSQSLMHRKTDRIRGIRVLVRAKDEQGKVLA